MKKVAKQQKAKKHSSANSKKIAQALVKHYPKDAVAIVKVMNEAATSKSMQRRLARVQRALENIKKAGA
jgi:hypothetical protein